MSTAHVSGTALPSRARSPLAYVALGAGLLGAAPVMAWLDAPALAAAIVLSWAHLRRIARILLAAGGAGAVVTLAVSPDLLFRAATSMTALAALVMSVLLLAELLTGSPDLGRISRRLFAGRPLPRYASISFGTGFLGVPLNFGSVGVVGGMVQSELEHGGDGPAPRNAARAVLRGFGSSSFCSPLSVAVAITLTFLPGLAATKLFAVMVPLAAGYLGLGMLFRERERPAGAPHPPERHGPAGPLLRLGSTVGAICIAVLTLHNGVGLGYAHAVALTCTAAVMIGSTLPALRGGPRPAVPSLAGISNELAIMGGSAFLGVLASGFALGVLGPEFGLPGWAPPLAALLVPWILFLGGILGLNPIVTGTLVGGVLGPVWPSAAVLGLAVSMLSGWGITVAGTPYSAAALILSRLTGYDNVRLALHWNRGLSVTGLLAGGGLGAGITYLFG